MREVKLKSGATLTLRDTPFEKSKALFQAVVKNLKSVEISKGVNSYEGFVGALLGSQLSDNEIERCLWECMACCTYNAGAADVKVAPDLFEDETRRGDFIDVCLEVGQENLRPFMKGLWLALPHLLESLGNIPKAT